MVTIQSHKDHMSKAFASFETLFPDIAGNFSILSYIGNGWPHYSGQPAGRISTLYWEDSNLNLGE
jgi:hypothetical protein